jgi:hypothetical protein
METSDALDLEPSVFKQRSPRRIAASLKRSAERSHRRKSDPYRSAMSMLTFYINRAGRKLAASQKATLEKAKVELRRLFGRGPTAGDSRPRPKPRPTRRVPRAKRPQRPGRAARARTRSQR